jgi:hypothetical protein
MRKKSIAAVFILVLAGGGIMMHFATSSSIRVIQPSLVNNVPTPETTISETKNVSTPAYFTILKFITSYLPFKERGN